MKTECAYSDTAVKTILRQNPLFTGCSDRIDEIAAACDKITFPAGETVVTPALTSSYLGIVISGTLQVYADHTGEKKLLRVLDKGKLFGVVGLLDGQRYASLIIAKTDAVVLCIPREIVLQLLKTESTFTENYVRFLTGRIRFLNRKVEYLSQGSAAARVAAYLLSLVPHDYAGTGPITVIPDYTAVELSELLNLGRASLYRAFDVLGRDGLVRKNGKVYEIIEIKKLKLLLNKEAQI